MGKNILPIVLIILAIGVYVTYTSGKIDEIKSVQAVNDGYASAVENARKLITVRDSVRNSYNKISDTDKSRLDKILPNNIDNVRLIIDVNGIAARHGFALKNVRTSAGADTAKAATAGVAAGASASKYNTVTISFGVATTYDNFISFLQDIERSLRILDISSISLSSNESGVYDYGVQLKTYWLKQ